MKDTPAANSRPRRHWLRFGLRAFFVFVTLVACAAAWIGSQMARRHQEQAAIATLTGRNGDGTTTTVLDSRFDKLSASVINPLNPPWQGNPAGLWKKLRNLDMFRRVVMFSSFPKGNTFYFDQDADGRLAIKQEFKSGLTNADMLWIRKLANLRSLWLEANGITDEGLLQLNNLNRLEILWLQHTAVTDDGLSVLANFPELRDLDLSGTHVTDAGIDAIAKCRQLKHLALKNTNVTSNGIQILQKALPDCKIGN